MFKFLKKLFAKKVEVIEEHKDYSGYTRFDMIKILNDKGVKGLSKKKKEELIDLMKQYDA